MLAQRPINALRSREALARLQRRAVRRVRQRTMRLRGQQTVLAEAGELLHLVGLVERDHAGEREWETLTLQRHVPARREVGVQVRLELEQQDLQLGSPGSVQV